MQSLDSFALLLVRTGRASGVDTRDFLGKPSLGGNSKLRVQKVAKA